MPPWSLGIEPVFKNRSKSSVQFSCRHSLRSIKDHTCSNATTAFSHRTIRYTTSRAKILLCEVYSSTIGWTTRIDIRAHRGYKGERAYNWNEFKRWYSLLPQVDLDLCSCWLYKNIRKPPIAVDHDAEHQEPYPQIRLYYWTLVSKIREQDLCAFLESESV